MKSTQTRSKRLHFLLFFFSLLHVSSFFFFTFRLFLKAPFFSLSLSSTNVRRAGATKIKKPRKAKAPKQQQKKKYLSFE